MDQYIITITKQYASLGGRIGKRVAEKLGIPVYNRESLEQEAAELDASLLPLIQNEEQMNNYYKMAYPLGIGSSIKQNRMFELQLDLILKHAKSERCVIIGRCADYILREYENTLKCYIFAPYPARVKNTICLLGRTTAEPQRIIEEVDKARAAYYRSHTDCEVNNTRYRDAFFNSAALGIEGTADMIVDMAKRKFHLA